MVFSGFNLTRGIICQWFFVYIPVTNVIISGKKLWKTEELSSGVGMRHGFHRAEFMVLDDCQRNYVEINTNEFSTNRKEMWEVGAEFFKSFD